MKKSEVKSAGKVVLPPTYAELLADIKRRVSVAQVRAHLAVSRELILLYWGIGRDIVTRQKSEGWGKAVIENLASDLRADFSGLEGVSANNIWSMRAFYIAYNQRVINLAPTVQEIGSGLKVPILAQPVQEFPPAETLAIPWYHNVGQNGREKGLGTIAARRESFNRLENQK